MGLDFTFLTQFLNKYNKLNNLKEIIFLIKCFQKDYKLRLILNFLEFVFFKIKFAHNFKIKIIKLKRLSFLFSITTVFKLIYRIYNKNL